MDYESFYESLKYHLEKKGYGGQALICRHTDIPRSYLSRIMNRGRKAGIRTQKKIARFFGYGLEEFIEVGRRISLGENPENRTDLFKNMPEEHLVQRLTEAVRKEVQTSQLLDETQLLYENIIENSRQMIVRFDENMNVTFVNSACERLTGQVRTKLLDMNWQDLVNDKYHEKLMGMVEKLHEKGGSFSTELPGKFEKRWLYLTVTIFPENARGKDKGQLVGFDITKEILIRKKLEELVYRFKFIHHGVEKSYVPTLWIGDRANIVYVNQAVCKLLEYTKQELSKMHVWDINPLITREDWPNMWTWFQSEENVNFTGQYRTKSEEIIPVEFQVSNLEYPNGRRFNVVFVKPIGSKKIPPTKKTLPEDFHRE